MDARTPLLGVVPGTPAASRRSQCLLAVSIGLTMCVYALDQGVTTTFFNFLATSSFGRHSDLATVTVASQIVRAISKPFIGKLSDVTSRPTTYIVVLCFYVAGFALAALSTTFSAYAIGICATSIGKSGLDLLGEIIVGDLTPLQWRGFFGSLLSVPFVFAVPINGLIVDALGDGENWRYGMGCFAVAAPIFLAPAICTLAAMRVRGEDTLSGSGIQRKATQTSTAARARRPDVRQLAVDVDLVGLLLLGTAFSLLLLPLKHSHDIADPLLCVGLLTLAAFFLYEVKAAPRPLMSRRLLGNRAFLAAVVVDVTNQMSGAVRSTFLPSYMYVVTPWPGSKLVWFLGVTTLGLSALGPVVGLLQRHTHRYKVWMVVGNVGKLAGYAVLVDTTLRAMTTDPTSLWASQVLLCLGAFSVVGARVGSQASVPREELSTVIFSLSLWSTLGSSVGGAIASSLWSRNMLVHLYAELPGVPRSDIQEMYADITSVRKMYAIDDPIRQGVIRAYASVNGPIAWTALALGGISLLATFAMPDYYLGREQNAVDQRDHEGGGGGVATALDTEDQDSII